MKYMKTLGLLAVAAAAFMACAGSASAQVTSPAGTEYEGEFAATSTNTALDGTIDITCKHSSVAGTLASKGATNGTITSLTFTECSRSVTVTAKGTLSINSGGEVRSTGARVTVQTTILGIPVHCIYATESTKVGTLTEGVSPAVMHIGSAAIPWEQTDFLCGKDAEWTGTYTLTKPTSAIVVD